MHRSFSVPLLLVSLFCVVASPVLGDEANDAGFTQLFNGQDLTGWKTGPESAWVVRDGELTVERPFDGAEHNHDYLWTQHEYGDFVLRLEFKLAEDTNSGIFLRTANLEDPVYTGLEIQVANSFGNPGLSRTGTAGALYDCQAPTVNAVHAPGEWNTCVITCRGPQVHVELNGQKILDANLDEWTQPRQNPDGSRNKFATPIKDFARRGYLGLQDHGRRVWYRNIEVKSLDDK
jgi:hypothetical protein